MPNNNSKDKKLIKRYLLWCHKTTKEEIERIDRKFTQLEVDYFVLNRLKMSPGLKDKSTKSQYMKNIDSFKTYIGKKEKDAYSQKYSNNQKKLNPDYLYLKNRLKAVEHAIIKFLGKKSLKEINNLYQQEMIKRILEAREH